jgi:hypothetical protein
MMLPMARLLKLEQLHDPYFPGHGGLRCVQRNWLGVATCQLPTETVWLMWMVATETFLLECHVQGIFQLVLSSTAQVAGTCKSLIVTGQSTHLLNQLQSDLSLASQR